MRNNKDKVDVDKSLISWFLSLTPEQRLSENDRAARQVLKLRKAFKASLCAIAVICTQACYPYEHQAGPFNAHDGKRFAESWGDIRCEHGDLAVRVFNAGLVELEKIFPDAAILNKLGVATCLVPEPVTCVSANISIYDPENPPPYGTSQRYAGCAVMGTFWSIQASINWPPVCKPEWPTERHCVTSAYDQKRIDYFNNRKWIESAAHELLNLYALRVLQAVREIDIAWLHTTEPGGTWDRVRAAMVAEADK